MGLLRCKRSQDSRLEDEPVTVVSLGLHEWIEDGLVGPHDDLRDSPHHRRRLEN